MTQETFEQVLYDRCRLFEEWAHLMEYSNIYPPMREWELLKTQSGRERIRKQITELRQER